MLIAPTASTRLYEQVLEAFPTGDFAFGALLEILDIVESSKVPTAAVECTGAPHLLINPEFVSKHAETPEKLFMLILHELHHILLGHTRLFPMVTPLDNLVFDAIINATLCKALPAMEYRALFLDFYSPERFPECMLRPPENPDFPTWPFHSPGVLESDALRDAKEVYGALYLPKGATYGDLRRVLRDENLEENGLMPLLLGDHSGNAYPEYSHVQQGLREALQKLVRGWPNNLEPIQGRSIDDVTTELHIKPRRTGSNRARLRRLLERVGGVTASGTRFRRTVDDVRETASPIPRPDRRATVLGALGGLPLLYNHADLQKMVVPAGERVHVYLDVSGSVSGVLNALYGAVLDCEHFVHPRVHLFSTKIASISIASLRRGECHTTGGTDINCVANHMRKHGVRRAVVVTDGYVGDPEGVHEQVMKQVRLGVALIAGCSSDLNLKPYADFTTSITLSEKKKAGGDAA